MKVVVLAGGLSPERIVSLSSGTMACNAFLKAGHQAILLDLFFGMPELDVPVDQLFRDAKPLPPAPISETEPDLAAIAASRPVGWSNRIGLNVIEICQQADIVYMALHGADGENGSVQKVFDEYGIRYSDAYEVYGLTRTGCCGCPISYKAVEDLEKIRPYEPNVVKAAWNIFGASYRYRQKYVAYKAERDRREKEAKKEVQGQCSFEMR